MRHWLQSAAGRHPDRVALLDGAGEVSYAELGDRARVACAALRSMGVAEGDRVALALPAGADFVAALHGCWFAGAVPVPVDLRLGPDERAGVVSGAAVVVDRALDVPAVSGEPTELKLESVAVVMHTSGTTSAPRRVELTFGNWLWNALGSAVALGLDQDERWLCPMPLVHVGGLSIPIRSAIYGTTAVLRERFEVDRALASLMDAKKAITLVSLVPTMLGRLLDAGLRRPPTLRWVLLGGGPIAPALLERAEAAGVPTAPTYGMTEACSQIATHGWPLAGVEVRIADDGEVLVRGPTVSPSALGRDGWLHTGDLGALDERGRLRITGRRSEVIVSGGENVAPVEVEAVLLEHPAVVDAAVHARLDPEWGEAVVATVVLRDSVSVDAGELRAHCAARLAAFKVPKAVQFARSLPRGQTGKLLRGQL